MRRLIVLALVAASGLLLAGRFIAPPVPEGPLRVVTDDPVRVVLPVNASATVIEARTRVAIEEAVAAAASAEMRSELEALAADRDTIEQIAGTSFRRLTSGEAAALAFPWFRVDAGGDRLTIYSVTVELIPGGPGIAVSRDHEDGHSEVNDQLALRCGPDISAELIEAGRRGARLEWEITVRLHSLADRAHDRYHALVVGAPLGSHRGYAKEAATEVVADGCH